MGIELFAIVFLSIIGFLLIVWNIVLGKRYKKLEKYIPDGIFGQSSLSPETQKSLQKLDKDVQNLYEINSKINKIARRGVCKIGITKFNALGEKNGQQSFAIALLNYKDSGIVISNLQTSQGSRLFIRQIQEGEEIYGTKLLDEEKKSLEKARQVVL